MAFAAAEYKMSCPITITLLFVSIKETQTVTKISLKAYLFASLDSFGCDIHTKFHNKVGKRNFEHQRSWVNVSCNSRFRAGSSSGLVTV